MTINVRPGRPEDVAFVANTLARCMQETAIGRRADWPALFGEMKRLIAAWESDGATLLCAVHPEDDDAIVGFAIGAAPVLHWVYVRGDRDGGLRGQGIARELLSKLGRMDRYTLPPACSTSLVRRMTYAPSLTAGYVP